MHRTFDNLIENNIFANGEIMQLVFLGKSVGDPCTNNTASGNIFRRNIVSYTSNGSLFYTRDANPSIEESDFNLYYNTPQNSNEDNFNLDWWKETYDFDSNSIVTDPLFVNPNSDNYKLQLNSPAFDLGFTESDFSDVGPRGEVGPYIVGCDIDSDCELGTCSDGSTYQKYGCSNSNSCILVNYFQDPCQNQLAEGSQCEANSECETNFCSNSICSKQNYFGNIINWFNELFS